jgi:hypothetical protein
MSRKPEPVDIVDRYPNQTVIEVAQDTCDACGAQAFVYAEMPDGRTVSYCAHHGTAYWARLNEQAVKVIDFRWRVGLPEWS